MSAKDAIEQTLDAEDADSAARFWNSELDRIVATMRGDADALEKCGQFAGAKLLRSNAGQLEGALGHVREAQAALDQLTQCRAH